MISHLIHISGSLW